jgi:fluoride ion exporter CrcB/FEX
MSRIVGVLISLAGVIHILPVPGVLGGKMLEKLYGIEIRDPSLLILLQHRAVIFGILGTFMIYSSFVPELQKIAIIAGYVSVISFLLIAWSTGGYNGAVSRVVIADLFALTFLIASTAIHFFNEVK